MKRIFAVTPLILAALAPVTAANAQADTETVAAEQSKLEMRAQDVVAVLKGTAQPEDVFADSFLTAVPPAQLAAMNSQLSAQFGEIEAVERIAPADEYSGAVTFRFEKALGQGQIALDPNAPHKIAGLQLTSFEARGDTLEKVKADFEALPGDVGILFTRLDSSAEPIWALHADDQFAIGSTFKLYILSALARSIENGERDWSDVIRINRKSFPSGRLQTWPDGAPITLQSAATLMISISDNTATDLLLHELGRETVEAELLRIGHSDPAKALPFLSTLEMFGLKGSPENLAKYVAGDEARKRAILADFVDDVNGNPGRITPPRFVEPTAIDEVEWFASGNDLKLLAKRLSEIDDPTARKIMAVNPSLPLIRQNDWLYTGFKGGSEPGVLNFTWLLQDEAERWHVLTMSWNNTEANVDETAFELLSQRLIMFAF